MQARVIENTDEMRDFAMDFVAALAPGASAATVVALSGELGAGKTTFTQAAAKSLGVTEAVNSPTFVIEKIYALSGQKWVHLVHVDAYRLKSADELSHLGWSELVADPANLVIIEWPEHVEGAIPQSAYRISIEIGEGEQRTLHYGS